jgi:hypothetical protein
MPERRQGRDREIDEIVRMKRAAQVGRLLLGELNGPMASVFPEDFADTPRTDLQKQREGCRVHLKGEIEKFCRRNFDDLVPEDLAALYIPLHEHGSELRIPLVEFIERYGRPRPGVLRGAPLHCTVHLSPWGLQTEYPEQHLTKDLIEAYNGARDNDAEIEALGIVPWERAKAGSERDKIGALWRRRMYHQRMTLITCFNLVEAYVNGIAWEHVQQVGTEGLSENHRSVLVEDKRPINTIDKLIKIPRIVAGRDEGPLHQSRDPLKTFLEVVKPFRDAVVHASPFDAPEKFGGYDKLAKLYSLDMVVVESAVNTTLAMVSVIHEFLGREGSQPSWLPERGERGRFKMD